jgi:hypothetical protein
VAAAAAAAAGRPAGRRDSGRHVGARAMGNEGVKLRLSHERLLPRWREWRV